MSHHILEFKNVFYSYPDGTNALNGISLRITHGEAVGIVGANGSGKSTLLMHANGYLLPASGHIIVGDDILTKETRTEIRKKVGMVFQNPDDQLFMPTVYEDVAFGPLNLGWDRARVEEKVMRALNIVGCSELKDKPPHHLSGGQKSAVAIASVIAMDPDILVMDEPASSLDPRSRRQLIELLKGFDHTRVIASHDLDLILEVCRRCVIIKDGRIAADGPAEKILRDRDLLEQNNLELPLSMQKIDHSRNNNSKEEKLNDLEKLEHLLGHWAEHNIEHARSYAEWAEKAKALGKTDLAAVLARISDETKAMDSLFRQAAGLCR
jgi:cobalt/nickel transport system ATP-binding protein